MNDIQNLPPREQAMVRALCTVLAGMVLEIKDQQQRGIHPDKIVIRNARAQRCMHVLNHALQEALGASEDEIVNLTMRAATTLRLMELANDEFLDNLRDVLRRLTDREDDDPPQWMKN